MPGIPTLCDKTTDGHQMVRGNRMLYAILSYISVNTVDIYVDIVQFEASVLGLHQYEFYATKLLAADDRRLGKPTFQLQMYCDAVGLEPRAYGRVLLGPPEGP